MDEQINKLKKDFKRFPEYFKLIIDKMVDQGLSFATNPSTNGWTTEMLLQKIRSRLYMENNGAEHHQTRDVIKKTNDPTPAMRANKFRNNNNNRKSIRIASRQGRYANQQNNQLAPNNAFAKRDNGLVVPRPNPYKMYNTRSSFKKKFINPNNYVGKKQQHGYANNINSLDPSSQSSSNNNSNQQTFAPQANYDIHGKNNKFPNKSKQVKFASKSPVGKKVGNYNNYGTGAGVKQPYSTTRKNYELVTLTTDIENFVLDIFKHEAEMAGIQNPKISGLLKQYPGSDVDEIKISNLAKAIKGMAESFQMNNMYGKGDLANYRNKIDFLNRFWENYESKAVKEINAKKRDKASTPEAIARAEEDKRKIMQGLDYVKAMFADENI